MLPRVHGHEDREVGEVLEVVITQHLLEKRWLQEMASVASRGMIKVKGWSTDQIGNLEEDLPMGRDRILLVSHPH